jgi:hypothetical protein
MGLELAVLTLVCSRRVWRSGLGSCVHPSRWPDAVGTDPGGMTVEAVGPNARAHSVRGVWPLVAEAGDGPSVPTLPAIAALRALADGRIAYPGRRLAPACFRSRISRRNSSDIGSRAAYGSNTLRPAFRRPYSGPLSRLCRSRCASCTGQDDEGGRAGRPGLTEQTVSSRAS